MDKLKQWVALAVVGSLAVVAGGWFLLVSPKRAEAQDLRAQAAAQVVANDQLETQLKVLRAQAKELPKKQADIARIAGQIPDNPSLPALIRGLSAASAAAGIDFVSITPGTPAAPVAKAAAKPAAPETAAAQTTPTAGAPPKAPASAGTLTTIPIALNVVGDFYNTAQFVANVETMPRAMRVVDLSIAPGAAPSAKAGAAVSATDGRSLATTINAVVFMAANRPPATAVVAPVTAPAK